MKLWHMMRLMEQNNGTNGGSSGSTPAGNNAQNGSTPNQSQRMMAWEEVQSLLNQARTETRAQVEGRIEHERQERIRLQQEQERSTQELTRLREEMRQRELAGMQPDQRVQAQINDLTSRLEQQAREAQQQQSALQAQLRATTLAAYRERAIRAYGSQIIAEMVTGDSEAAIDSSAHQAHQAWVNMMNSMRTQIQQELGRNAVVTPAQVPQQPQFVPQPLPQAVLPPPNPAYVQPMMVPPGSQVGFPQPVQPLPVADASAAPFDIRQLTSEEAVRNGRWSGELREQVLAQLRRGQPGAVNLGSTPRHLMAQPPTELPQVQLPGGVIQPQGTPMGPVTSPAAQQFAPHSQVPQVQPQQQQYVQPQQMVVQQPQMVAPNDPRAMAAAAIERTYAGQNPVLAATPGAQEALQQALQTGQTAHGAFAARFSPTPPVAPGQN